jgi:hypothetical protein
MKTPLNLLIWLCLPAASLFAQSGSVAGSVTDQSNKPVTGAIITANRQTPPAASGRATSGAGGTFQVSGLQPGQYEVCVQVPK